ncbi:MAG: diguanylate cyclase [Thermodesulfobacteriota bacterium]
MLNPPPDQDNITVLLVEDDQPVRELLTRLVDRHGHRTIACDGAEAALEAFREHGAELVLVDWLLPGMDGLELSRRLRAMEGGKYLTIVMSSAKDSPEDIATATDAGVNFFMVKPIEKQVLDIWLSVARKHVLDCRQRRRDDQALAAYQAELEENNLQLEEALCRANTLATEAEQAYIEINQIFKTVAGGILLVDKKCNLLRCNDSFLKMAGIDRQKANGAKCHDLFRSGLCDTDGCPLKRIKKGEKRIEQQVERVEAGGEIRYYHTISTPFTGPAGDLIGIVEHITDITERVKAEMALAESEQRYRELSIIDELTGLYNKRYFNKQLELEAERARRYGHPLSLLLMDIDNFKHHNDTYGHADGDRVLARLGRVIAGSLRTNDVPCRYGGEEFTIILPATTGAQAVIVAERIRGRFAEEAFHPAPDKTVHKTVSIGVAEFLVDDSTQSFVERADRNMYAAKQGGKNRFVLA